LHYDDLLIFTSFAVFYAIYTEKLLSFVKLFNSQNKNNIEVAFDLKILGY